MCVQVIFAMLKILTTAYNCEKYLMRCLASIKAQRVKDFVCYFMDDMSTDATPDIFKAEVGTDSRFVYIGNTEKKWQGGNYDYLLRVRRIKQHAYDIDDEDICINIDADDWLPEDPHVFDRVLSYYADGNTWLTYGSFNFIDGPGTPPERLGWIMDKPIKDLRTELFTAGPLRTWKAFLWRAIKEEDLKCPNYWDNGLTITHPQSAGDLFYMWPMIEMCGKAHYKCVSDVNYIYNTADAKYTDAARCCMRRYSEVARHKQPYAQLSR